MVHKEQELKWTGRFSCEHCKGTGERTVVRAAAAFQEVEETGGCGECDEGSVQIDCLIVFDITPGIPPIISGPPEQCDPGCGPEIHQIRIMSKDGRHDWTDTCRNIDDASEFACDNWAPEEVDCDDKNTE